MSHAFEIPPACEPPPALPPWGERDRAALREVGRPAPRASARAKVTGQAAYTTDIVLPGLAHAVIVRATIARGRVTGFDAETARRQAGVLAVFGPLETPAWPGIGFTAEMAAAGRRTRAAIAAEIGFHGEEIGVVVASDEASARGALRHLRIQQTEQAAVLDIAASQAADAPALGPLPGNRAQPDELVAHGDLASARALADVTVHAHYSTDAQHHNTLEPHGCVAWWRDTPTADHPETLTLWDSSQGPHMIREQLAYTFGLALDAVRVVSHYVGGGFGSKIHLKPYHVIAVESSRRLGRPVRLVMNRREEFIASQQRAATTRQITLGASRAEGRLRFIDEVATGQAGPTPWFARNAAGALNGLRLHRADAVRATLQRVLSNTQAPTPFRGPTAAEDLFCLEQAIDELADALGQDPLAFRRRQMAEIDLPTGLPYAGKQLDRCYALGAEAFGWRWQAPQKDSRAALAHGIGVGAVAYDSTPFEPSRAGLALRPDGMFELRLGLTEIGCGSDTVFAQVAAEALQLPLALFDTRFGDSRLPRSIDATNHSRTLTVVGPAVRQAAHTLRARLLHRAAQHLQVGAAALSWSAEGIGTDSARLLRWHALAAAGEILVHGEREAVPAGLFPAMFGVHFVEVQVERDSGRVRVVRAVCAHDAGLIINPRLATSQVQGGFLQGMGMALQEERLLDAASGAQLNATMWAYRTPSIVDAPPEIRFIDAGRPDGGNSLGVKGLGEPPLIAAGAAIANAVFNALGVRLRHYPITPERVLAALAGKAS